MLASATGITAMAGNALAGKSKKTNLLIIHTDEHNFRTLGCYRELMPDDQAFVWGEGVKVDTPHIDSIAHDGAICTSYYASSPVCTPSRASFVTGLYPIATGSPVNNMPMHDGLATFASVLKDQGYATSYVGKWHLDGDAKPGFEPARKFGFSDNRYMMNRGHWKGLSNINGKPAVIGLIPEKESAKFNVSGSNPENFTTDFLTTRSLEILERDKGKPFCLMLSIPDPHGPNSVRPPYDTMFKNFHFENPRTMDVPVESMPIWAQGGKELVSELNQKQMQIYFGMVKCIDDNVGRLLEWLEANGLADNTIVVFTSDHGDLMGEHKKHNKGSPFETSAKIPFLIRYPEKIAPGKMIHTAYTTVDFPQTILGIMGAPGIPGSQGLNDAKAFTSPAKKVEDGRVTYITASASGWVAAVNNRCKLVISESDIPWLFDLKKDPDELINFYLNPEYAQIGKTMMDELVRQMKAYNEPGLAKGKNYLYSADQKVPANTGGKKKGGKLKADKKGEYLIDEADLELNAKGAKKSSWNRVLEVPTKSFAPNTTYALTMEWESKGLDKGADFFVNFVGDKSDKTAKQLHIWKAAAGESGTLTLELSTNDSNAWQLTAGIRGGGHLAAKRIQIKKK